MTLSHGMPASELPTPSTLSRDDVDSLLDPNAKGGPELRPNAWLTEEIIRLEAAIGSGDPLEAAFARIDLSFRLANKEPGRSLELAAEALRAAEELGNERAIARGHLCVGWGIYNTNPTEWRKASEHGLDAEYAFHDLDERIWEAHAMILRLGLAGYTGVRSVASALEGPIFELLREPCGDEYLRFLGLGRLTLSLTYFATDTDSTLEAARRYLALTVAYARAAPEPIHVGQVQQVVGDLLRMAGDPARARAHFSRAVRIAAKHGASMVTLNAMRGQADCFLDEHDIDAAKEVLEEIRKLVGSDLRFYLAGSMASYLEFKILKAERKWDAAEQVVMGLSSLVGKLQHGVSRQVYLELIDLYRSQGTLDQHLDVYDRLIEAQNEAMSQLATMQLQGAELDHGARERDAQRRLADLLRSFVPASVYAEIAEKGESEPKYFPNAVLFFSDFAGFTKIASALTPRQVIEELSDLFENFDQIMTAHGCERIETIGDAYVAAAGLTNGNPGVGGDAAGLTRGALQIQDYLAERNRHAEAVGGSKFIARIGLHTGPIIGGMVGRERRRYAIFGDAVNTTQRLEAACVPGEVLISESIHRAIAASPAAAEFAIEPRGEITPKGKGSMPVWRVAFAGR